MTLALSSTLQVADDTLDGRSGPAPKSEAGATKTFTLFIRPYIEQLDFAKANIQTRSVNTCALQVTAENARRAQQP